MHKPPEILFNEILDRVSGFNHIAHTDKKVIVTFTEEEVGVVIAALTGMVMSTSDDNVHMVAGMAGLKLYNGMKSQITKNRKPS